jgi:hypothetical protein
MDNRTKITTLSAEVLDRASLMKWWSKVKDAPTIPTYWKGRGHRATLKVFGSNGNVCDLTPYTTILGTKKKMRVKGWLKTNRAIVLVLDPMGIPTDLENPYLILSSEGDLVNPELVKYMIQNVPINPSSFELDVKIGYVDRLRRTIRFDIPEDLL